MQVNYLFLKLKVKWKNPKKLVEKCPNLKILLKSPQKQQKKRENAYTKQGGSGFYGKFMQGPYVGKNFGKFQNQLKN